MSREKEQAAAAARAQRILFYVVCAAITVSALAFLIPAIRSNRPGHAGPTRRPTDAELFATYAGSQDCRSCHQDEFKLWESSHHALAERPIKPELDQTAFAPKRELHHGSQDSSFFADDGKFIIRTLGPDNRVNSFPVERVIGEDPLRQFLIASAGGRYQVSELAFGPRESNWFDVYGSEDRKPGEWGHWTGRGMTWNSMCADCHNTRVRKNYQADSDFYATRFVENGVGCESCHGPMSAHNSWQAKHPRGSGDPTIKRIKREEMFAVCGACHARRSELTGNFQPGENFTDHYSLMVPDETELFYADGQVHDEDFEFTAFMGSKMRAAGVRCVECHEPHSAKIRVPGNNMCLTCHAVPTPPAPKVDPATHSHHKAGSAGSECVSCHMPTTMYMQRHGRHDHGFTIPDPLLTKELGIPNACNRCHADQKPDWAVAALEKWGAKGQRLPRERTRVIARARTADKTAVTDLLKLTQTETNSFWRAVAANLLKRWADKPKVQQRLTELADESEPLVRAMSLRALAPLASAPDRAPVQTYQKHLTDASRGVRIETAWALHATLDTNSVAGKDLLSFLRHNQDQPSGALQLGIFNLDRNNLPAAMELFQRALAWDTNSAPLYQALAVGLSLEGNIAEAVKALENACRIAPRDADSQFKLGLALNEAGRTADSRKALERAVQLEPGFAQAWYNLGLAWNAEGQLDLAIEALLKAESLEPRAAQFPYARATILAKAGKIDEAKAAARRALELEPGWADAQSLLQSLSQ